MVRTPPGSLSEGAAERSEAEGVSSDGSSGPMIYPQAIIDSETFDRLRSSKYTPSVSHSLDSSLREGAGNGLHHSTGYSLKSGVGGRFSSPLRRLRNFYIPPFSGGGNNLLGRLVKIFEKYLTNGQMCASIAPSIFESGLRRQ